MKQHTASEKFNSLRPSVFFDDWELFGWPMRLALALVYALLLLAGLIAVIGIGQVVHLLFNGEWRLLLIVALICFALTPSRRP